MKLSRQERDALRSIVFAVPLPLPKQASESDEDFKKRCDVHGKRLNAEQLERPVFFVVLHSENSTSHGRLSMEDALDRLTDTGIVVDRLEANDETTDHPVIVERGEELDLIWLTEPRERHQGIGYLEYDYRKRWPLTELGNAERLVHYHRDDLRHCPGVGWLARKSTHWERDDGEAARRMKETVRAIYPHESKLNTGPKDLGDIIRFAKASEANGKLRAALEIASTEPELAIKVEDLDADGMLFNVANGTIDLRTGQLRGHRREDLLTKCSPVAYSAAAAAPTWEAFLLRVVPDAEVRAFLKRFAGYSLTTDTSEHCLAFLHGNGANGKSVFLNAVRSVLGPYAIKAPRGLLASEKPGADKHSTEMMPLLGARMAWCSETNKGDTWDESKVKDLTSEDPITARLMRQDNVTFNPTHKFWICGNHKPRVNGADEGIWRRLRIVPFNVTIPEAERDRSLGTKLEAELPGILRWCVEGCVEWQREGLGAPKAVSNATDAYRVDQDAVQRFIVEACKVAPPGLEDRIKTKASVLYGAYCAWSAGETMSAKEFSAALTAKGYERKRQGNGWFYLGLGLPAEDAAADEPMNHNEPRSPLSAQEKVASAA